MSNVTTKIKQKWDMLFHDKIIDIEEPREWHIEYRDIGKRLEGYIVPVTYKYRGKCNKYFIIDYDHFQLISKQRAQNNANLYYQRVREELDRNKIPECVRGNGLIIR